MSTLGWSLLGLAIWIAVSLAIPLVAALIMKPADEEEARWYVGLAWLWPVLGPFLLLAAPVILLSMYADFLPTLEKEKHRAVK